MQRHEGVRAAAIFGALSAGGPPFAFGCDGASPPPDGAVVDAAAVELATTFASKSAAVMRLAGDLRAFAAARHIYDQVRWIGHPFLIARLAQAGRL